VYLCRVYIIQILTEIAVVDDLRDRDENTSNCDDGGDVLRASNQRPRRRHRRPTWLTNYVCGVCADSGYTASGIPVEGATPRGMERPPVINATAGKTDRPQQVVQERSQAVGGDATQGAASGEREGQAECPLCHKSFARGGWVLTRHINAYGWAPTHTYGQGRAKQLTMRDLRKMTVQEYEHFREKRTNDARPTSAVIQLWLERSVPEPRDYPALPRGLGRAPVESYAAWTALMNANYSNKRGRSTSSDKERSLSAESSHLDEYEDFVKMECPDPEQHELGVSEYTDFVKMEDCEGSGPQLHEPSLSGTDNPLLPITAEAALMADDWSGPTLRVAGVRGFHVNSTPEDETHLDRITERAMPAVAVSTASLGVAVRL
jgi:hypothetical protein